MATWRRCDVHFLYQVKSGRFSLRGDATDEAFLALGYSGRGAYLNDPAGESFVGLGPIPAGKWRIGQAVNHSRLGPQAIRLDREKIPYGRSGFFIHGDNPRGDFSASNGCIILGREVRDLIVYLSRWSGVRTLIVV